MPYNPELSVATSHINIPWLTTIISNPQKQENDTKLEEENQYLKDKVERLEKEVNAPIRAPYNARSTRISYTHQKQQNKKPAGSVQIIKKWIEYTIKPSRRQALTHLPQFYKVPMFTPNKLQSL